MQRILTEPMTTFLYLVSCIAPTFEFLVGANELDLNAEYSL